MQTRPIINRVWGPIAAHALSIIVILTIAFPVSITAYAASPSDGALQSAGAKILVTTVDDTLDPGDGLCSLREAVIAANTNSSSGDAPGECPAGTDDRKDIITLASGATYTLTIGGANEDEGRTGDLDIWDNSAEPDLIIGVQDGGAATIDASSLGDRLFDIFGATVNMTGLTLTGGAVGQEAEQAGGAVQIAGGSLTMASSVVTGNSSTWGGGIGSWGGTVKLSGTTVSNNTAPEAGGGLFNNVGTMKVESSVVSGNATNNGGGGGIWSNSLLYIASTDVSWNRASGGGGLYIQLDEGVVARTRISDHTMFHGNTASNVGGGISNDGDLAMNGGEVSGNSAPSLAGGIFNRYQAIMALDGVTVGDNAANDGGGLYNEGTLSLVGSAVSDNRASGGGGLRNFGTAALHASRVTGNSVTWAGGGISNGADSSVLIDQASAISGNSSDVHAGGIWNEGSMEIRDSAMDGNTAADAGGAVHNLGTLVIGKSILSANSAGQGGALYNTESGTATIEDGTRVTSGTASDGGGLFNLGDLTVEASEVSGNWGTFGGGLFNWTGGMLTVSNSLIANNSANEGGGLHNKEDSTAVIQNGTIISGNSAAWTGGGLDNWGALTVTGSVLLENTSPGEGDAVSSGVNTEHATSITGSCIVGNGDTAVFNSYTAVQNATDNWWGDASGPSGAGSGSGDSVGVNIDFSDWLTEAPPICRTP